MKIKGFIIAGIFIAIIGIGLCIYATTLEDFKITSTYENKTSEYDEINSIVFDGNQDNLIIVPSSDKKTHLNYYENNNYKYEINYNEITKELFIIQKGRHFFNFGNTIKDFKIEVYGLLNSIDVNTNAGNVQIDNFDVDELNIDIDAGNIKLNNMNINTLNCDIDAGNFNSENINVNNVTVDIDAGNIEYNGKIISCFFGNIDVGNCILELYQSKDEFIINEVGKGNIIITYDIDLGKFDIFYK